MWIIQVFSEGSSTFLKKRTKTLFPGASHEAVPPAVAEAPTDKSFLLLFFKKEALPSLSWQL
jgi:hypothetical protein